MIRRTTAVAVALALFIPGMVSAHDSFMAHRFGAWTLVNGHWGEGDDAYTLSSLANMAAHDAAGNDAAVQAEERVDHVAFLPGDGAVVLAGTYASGFWTKDTDGRWHPLPANEVANADTSTETYRHTIAVADHADSFTPFGLPLEIMPGADPLSLKAGDTLPVVVLFNGLPLADADLTSFIPGVAPVRTDAEGRAGWTVQPGENILLVAHAVDHPTPEKAQKFSNKVTLSFMAPVGEH
ncbi:DUF4198 domain-containing protein [Tropicimonas sp.]|uniref:DUF4198 domain-containing protein n=1 Tax=Tropicimonas sp. TaxID=2067044 RepID=UPI003A86C50D